MELRTSYDFADLDKARVVDAIQTSYWGGNRTADQILRSFENSSCAGLFQDGVQLGFVRAFSDKVFSTYINDLFVHDEFRGNGHAHRLLDALFDHPELSEIKHWMLATKDAHSLYEKHGFEMVAEGHFMGMTR